MDRCRYLLTYPDGSRKHVDREERDLLLLSHLAKQTAPGRYLYIGQVHRFSSFADLAKLSVLEHVTMRRRLPGSFTVETPDGGRYTETLETPEGLIERLIHDNKIQIEAGA